MKKSILFFILSMVISFNSMKAKCRKRHNLCNQEVKNQLATWEHDTYFYWPYRYYANHHPYYWHDGFRMPFGG